jgi:hypothetical protein
MLCPRCDRARIQRDGVSVRCAVCGMSYDPDQQLQSAQDTVALPGWLPADHHGAASTVTR